MILFSLSILSAIVGLSEQKIYSCDAKRICGCSKNSAAVNRIVGGEAAGIHTWSWAVSLNIDDRSFCGGSIISKSWVITAAHCIPSHEPFDITVYAGSTNPWVGTQFRKVSLVMSYPLYNPETFLHDIALLKLAEPLNLTDNTVTSICLPSFDLAQSKPTSWPPSRLPVVAVGWGALQEGGNVSDTLQQVTVNIVELSATTCAPLIRDSRYQLCAGVSNGSKDTCQGDSGGPLMAFNDEKEWILVGLTSSGIGCARKEFSGTYTRVSSYEKWIKDLVDDASWVTIRSNAFKSQSTFYTTIISVLFFHSI